MMLNLIKRIPEASGHKKYIVGALALIAIIGFASFEYRSHLAPPDAKDAGETERPDQRTVTNPKNDRELGEATKGVLQETKQFSGAVSQIVSLKEPQMKILTIKTFIIDRDSLNSIDFSDTAKGAVKDLPMRQENVDVVVNDKTALRGVTFDGLRSGDFVIVKTLQSVSDGIRLSAESLELVKAVDRKDRD
jgi:hypothetical protein